MMCEAGQFPKSQRRDYGPRACALAALLSCFGLSLLVSVFPTPMRAMDGVSLAGHPAVFQGCRPTRPGRPGFCSFVDRGSRLFVYGTGATPQWLMEELEGLDIGRRVALTGKRRDLYDGAAEVELAGLRLLPLNRYDRILQRLQGRWRSDSDPMDAFQITGAERVNAYAGAKTSVDYISIQPDCGSFTVQGPYLYAWDESGTETLCYEISKVSDTQLELIYQPRGKVLMYSREGAAQ